MDESGFYITIGQMQFFLNRRNGAKKLHDNDEEFAQYYMNCCMYNCVYDMTERDPDCAKVYWDSDNECVAVTYPVNGRVARELASLSQDDDDDDEFDDFGIIK